jgi:hypothetical protein
MNEKNSVSNDQFITDFRDWLSTVKASDRDVEHAISYAFKLAKLVAPVPLIKLTKALVRDFYMDEQMSPQLLESRGKLIHAQIYFDAFITEVRRSKTGGQRRRR